MSTRSKIVLVGNIGRSQDADTAPAVTVGDTSLSIIEFQGQRVVTLGMIDAVHKRPKGTARKRFNDNKDRLIEGEDFTRMSASEFRTRFPGVLPDRATSAVTLMAETGYLMLVKSFTDDLAWQVQRKLVTAYFRQRRESEPEQPAAPYSVGRTDTLTKAEQDQLRDAVMKAQRARPPEEQAEFGVQAWSKLKSHFHYRAGQNYRNIPRAQLGEALALVERHAAEFEPKKVQALPAPHPAAIGCAPHDARAALVIASTALAQVVPVLVELAGQDKAANDPQAPSRRHLRRVV